MACMIACLVLYITDTLTRYLNRTFHKVSGLTSYTRSNLSFLLFNTDTIDGRISLFDLGAFTGGSVFVGPFYAYITYHSVKGKWQCCE